MRHLKEIQQIKNAMEAATPKVTQEIIAEKTGKSTSLVSNVIRDRYSVIVSEETIKKVQSAINKAVGRNVFSESLGGDSDRDVADGGEVVGAASPDVSTDSRAEG